MRSPSSIFSFKSLRRVFRRWGALPYVLSAIAVLEMGAGIFLRSRAFNHEVDAMIYQIESRRFDSPVVLLGDSVGRNVFGELDHMRDKYAMLAGNYALEMTGQYYILRRYLEKNTKPAAVLMMMWEPFGQGINQVYSENYIERVFTRPYEIAEIALAKRSPVIGLRMAAYGLLPTYKHRLKIQKALLGFTNADVHTGLGPWAAAQSEGRTNPYRLLDRLQEVLQDARKEKIGDAYFERILGLLDREGIRFYFMWPPVPESTAADPAYEKDQRRIDERMRTMAKSHACMTVLDGWRLAYPDSYFPDGGHLGPEYRPLAVKDIAPVLDAILKGMPVPDCGKCL